MRNARKKSDSIFIKKHFLSTIITNNMRNHMKNLFILLTLCLCLTSCETMKGCLNWTQDSIDLETSGKKKTETPSEKKTEDVNKK